MRFRLCPLSLADIDDAEQILCGEERLSAIDRYSGLVRILQLVASKRALAEPVIIRALSVLAEDMQDVDPELTYILSALGDEYAVSLHRSSFEESICDLVEACTLGDYNSVIQACQLQ